MHQPPGGCALKNCPMQIEIKVPEAGESITQVELARWLVKDGDYVEKDQEIAEIDSDKATLTINAEAAGLIRLSLEEGTTTEPGKVIATIDTEAERPEGKEAADKEQAEGKEAADKKQAEGKEAADKKQAEGKEAADQDRPADSEDRRPADSGKNRPAESEKEAPDEGKESRMGTGRVTLSPQAEKLIGELGMDPDALTVNPKGTRITRRDILAAIASRYHEDGDQAAAPASGIDRFSGSWGGGREEERKKMSTLRRKVAERLVAVKNQTAMLTTFNEVDMTAILEMRKRQQDAFVKKYGIKLGFMSFFVKAVTESIPFFPEVNGRIEDGHIVIPAFADVGIAVSTPKGLMVPVVRNAESLSIPELETRIGELAGKARDLKIGLEELSGGTFSITNGGVFGSMLSTPIINPPQSAILGMHNILERPVAVNGKVEIRPMMYLALSYDHRVIDGRESVGFLVKVKEMIENPGRMLFGGSDPESRLLGL
jgi:2-oxoglutarate dehydrogenase E2 component (dihydrolipoamide succinyltransferase)